MAIALIPQHARRIKPPRVLAVPFDLGRPLGVPNDADFQLDVLRAALDLLVRESADPLFESYETEVETDENAEPWSCPVTFAPQSDEDTSWAASVRWEIDLLRPWYDKAVRDNGKTTVGLSGLEIDEIPEFLARFLDSPGNEDAPEGITLSDALKFAAEDLKAWYNEVATAQPGNATAKAVEHWYWNECQAGRMLRAISAGCRDHPDQLVQIVARFTLVPESQKSRNRPGSDSHGG